MLENLLNDGAREIGISLTSQETSKFKLYLKELLVWNKRVNLTAITEEREVIVKHFLDSLLVLGVFRISTQSIVDIGAGAGFPGIPVKIVKPDARLTLIDSVGKKIEFLKHLVSVLGLQGVEVIWGRVEDVVRQHRECFDLSVSRAVAPLNVLLEYSLPSLKIGGVMLALKGEDVGEEVASSKNALKLLGGRLKKVFKVVLPTTEVFRSIVIVEKISKTPEKFPRRAGMPKKRPL
jgi:16S rRNA (guanine527-N7)-methyltransferase